MNETAASPQPADTAPSVVRRHAEMEKQILAALDDLSTYDVSEIVSLVRNYAMLHPGPRHVLVQASRCMVAAPVIADSRNRRRPTGCLRTPTAPHPLEPGTIVAVPAGSLTGDRA